MKHPAYDPNKALIFGIASNIVKVYLFYFITFVHNTGYSLAYYTVTLIIKG